MRDYSIEEAIEIINSCDQSFMPDTKHFDVRNIQRIGDFDLIFETFLHNPLMGIIKQDYNKFRLYFEHNQNFFMFNHYFLKKRTNILIMNQFQH